MPALPRPSVSPLPSFAARPPGATREPSLAELLGGIWRWLTDRQPKPTTLKQQIHEQRLLDALAAEIAEQEEATRVQAEADAAPKHRGEKGGRRGRKPGAAG